MDKSHFGDMDPNSGINESEKALQKYVRSDNNTRYASESHFGQIDCNLN